jgi:thioredoxin:protein disulfide reductase
MTGGLARGLLRLNGGRLAAVFVMGGVSALIVSPCVAAPLAGALVYLSQTRDVLLGGTALFALAAGMSVPLLLLGASAGALLPKAGPWMEGIKRLFGVLLLGVALYLVQPLLSTTLAMVGWGLLLMIGAVLLLMPWRGAGALAWLRRAAGLAAGVFALMQWVGAASGGSDPLQPLAHLGGARTVAASGALPFRPVRNVAELDAAIASAGKPVMLDFYADWCVSCKEMERFTFSDAEVQRLLGGFVLLKADVTKNSAEDRELLRRFRLFGPPGTIFFDAEGRELTALRVIGFQGAKRFAETLRAVASPQ